LNKSVFVYGKLSGLFNEGKEIPMLLAAFGGTALLSSIWVNGRKFVKDKRKKELERIELHDMLLNVMGRLNLYFFRIAEFERRKSKKTLNDGN
jgi:hypothetical protein